MGVCVFTWPRVSCLALKLACMQSKGSSLIAEPTGLLTLGTGPLDLGFWQVHNLPAIVA